MQLYLMYYLTRVLFPHTDLLLSVDDWSFQLWRLECSSNASNSNGQQQLIPVSIFTSPMANTHITGTHYTHRAIQ
jgi:hypothetical protein